MNTYLDADTIADIPASVEVEIPDEAAIAEEWPDFLPARSPYPYETILEAEPFDPIAPTIAAAITLGAWLYDWRQGRYSTPKQRSRDKSVIVGATAIADLAGDRVQAATRRLDQINQRYNREQIEIDEWFEQADAEVQALHTELFILGRGGFRSMDRAARKALRDLLRFQRWKLSEFHGELITGTTLSPAQVANRLRLYAAAGRQTYAKGRLEWAKAAGVKVRRSLSPLVKEHCAQCPDYATSGYVDPKAIVPPGVACDCMAMCQCQLDFRSP